MMSTSEDLVNGVILIPSEKMEIVLNAFRNSESIYLADLTCYEIVPSSEIKGWVVGVRLDSVTAMS